MKPLARSLPLTRRRLLQALAALGVAGPAVARRTEAASAEPTWPEMTYRTLGRTGFRGSRLVVGCGAALMFFRKDDLLRAAFDHGVNVFDVGTSDFYRYAESNLSGFAKEKRERIFLISKGLVGFEVTPESKLTSEQLAQAARNWSKALDQSLVDLGVEHLDAYYVMACNNVALLRSDEMYQAFLAAKQAGKVDHWGFSTHHNAQNLLEAASAMDRYSLAQIAVTPAGWYDYANKAVLADSPPMKDLRPIFDKARAAGIGLIGMKAARHLAGSLLGFGPDRPTTFDPHYSAKLLQAKLSAFQRSYAFVLAHGLDAVNADSQSVEHLHENFTAAATSETYFS